MGLEGWASATMKLSIVKSNMQCQIQ